jgi:2-isopropylmalate synthase
LIQIIGTRTATDNHVRVRAAPYRPDPAEFNWNHAQIGPRKAGWPLVVDETLRDGLQSPSVLDPPVERKIEMLHSMARIGVDVVSVGLPAAGKRAEDDAVALAKAIATGRLAIQATAAGRTTANDVNAIARVSQRAGIPVTAYAFVGSSPIRRYVEGWSLDFIVGCIRTASEAARAAGLPWRIVLEDTTRTPPPALATIFRAAVECGASGIVLCDTVGHASPDGAAALVTFARHQLAAFGGMNLELDWHGHNDRGVALSNALAAARTGVDRVHGTALGIGERTGNVRIDHLIAGLSDAGMREPPDEREMETYDALCASALGWNAA